MKKSLNWKIAIIHSFFVIVVVLLLMYSNIEESLIRMFIGSGKTMDIFNFFFSPIGVILHSFFVIFSVILGIFISKLFIEKYYIISIEKKGKIIKLSAIFFSIGFLFIKSFTIFLMAITAGIKFDITDNVVDAILIAILFYLLSQIIIKPTTILPSISKLQSSEKDKTDTELKKREIIIVAFIFILITIIIINDLARTRHGNEMIKKVLYEISKDNSQNDQKSLIQNNEANKKEGRIEVSESLQDGSTRSMEPTEQDYVANKIAVIETNKGNIKLELYTNDAPKTVENFVKLANENFYDGIKFHRVISNFMIQGGDPLSKDDDPNNDGTGGPGYKFEDEINPISLELDEYIIQKYEASGYEYDYNLNSHKMEVGALAMANSGPNTNGSQFFIVTEKDQPHLNGRHTVFGKVVEGMETVLNIKQGDIMKKVYVIEAEK